MKKHRAVFTLAGVRYVIVTLNADDKRRGASRSRTVKLKQRIAELEAEVARLKSK